MAQLATNDIERDGANRFVQVLDGAVAAPVTPREFEVLGSGDQFTDTRFGRDFAAVCQQFPWKTSPRLDDHGTETVICELNDFIEMGDLWAGLSVLGEQCVYPLHDHPPQELYLVLSGAAYWRYGGSADEVVVPAGSLLYNNPGDRHSMRCEDEPLLALWFLWSG